MGQFLDQAGISEPYLQGYPTALAISPSAPSAPSAEAWLGSLLGGIEFSGERTLNRVLELVMIRANRINEDAAAAATVSSSFAALDGKALRSWAEGFDDLVTAATPAWPAKAQAADDKRVLKDIAAVSEGGDATALRTVLPAWVTQRHALRR